MARHPRLIFPDVALHIIQRGNNRNVCFGQDSDYLTYLAYLRHLSAKHHCAIHAYCLMTNHVHLLLTPEEPDACALLMRDLGRCYVRYFNRRHGRTGTLWEGRFRSCIAESSQYVVACYRYIELNLVRAGMVNHPRGYLWSSHAVNTGMHTDPMVKPHCEFLALAATDGSRHAAYRGLFEQPFARQRFFQVADDHAAGMQNGARKARPSCQSARRGLRRRTKLSVTRVPAPELRP